MKPWTLEDAIKLVAAITNDVQLTGYRVAIGGSVAERAKSDNDIDLYFLPWVGGPYRQEVKLLEGLLSKLWGNGLYGGTPKPRYPPAPAHEPDDEDEDGAFIPPPALGDPFAGWEAVGKVPVAKGDASKMFRAIRFTRPDGDRIDVFILLV